MSSDSDASLPDAPDETLHAYNTSMGEREPGAAWLSRDWSNSESDEDEDDQESWLQQDDFDDGEAEVGGGSGGGSARFSVFLAKSAARDFKNLKDNGVDKLWVILTKWLCYIYIFFQDTCIIPYFK